MVVPSFSVRFVLYGFYDYPACAGSANSNPPKMSFGTFSLGEAHFIKPCQQVFVLDRVCGLKNSFSAFNFKRLQCTSFVFIYFISFHLHCI